MGCVFSKHFGDHNPRIFQVWNVDDHGNHLSPGKIEVTRVDLILHQKGKTPIRWPLRSLRRYGFDAELFSFESGRRCPTGPGIYAFKCRQAESLFNVLQEFIQCRSSAGPSVNGIISSGNEERVGSVSSGPALAPSSNLPLSASGQVAAGLPQSGPQGPLLPSGLPAPMTVDNVGYLEPIGVAAAVAATQPRSGSLSSTSPMNGLPETISLTTISPARSSLPGLYGIQATPVPPNPLPPPVLPLAIATTCNCAACNVLGRASVVSVPATTAPVTISLPHQYVNSSVVVPEKAIVTTVSHPRPAATLSDSSHATTRDPFYVNGPPTRGPNCGQGGASGPPLPPTTISYVDQNTNYARLDDLLKQEQQHSAKNRQKDNNRFYENVTPETTVSNGPVTILGFSKTTRGTPTMSRSNTVTSPTGLTTPKSPVTHFYANLNSPPSATAITSNLAEVVLPSIQDALKPAVTVEDDHQEQDEDEPRVNYITLDLNHSQPSTDLDGPLASPPANGPVPPTLSLPGSPGNPTEGYATIDFDKTAALSNSSNPGLLDDSVRKTRHNSAIPIAISLTSQ